MVEYLEIGKIVNTHGIKGEVRVIPLTDDPKRFELLDGALVDVKGELKEFTINMVRYFKSFVLIKFNEISSIEDALTIKGCFIKVDRKHAVILPENSFFICDLIESNVYNEFDDSLIGKLKAVLQTGSNDVYQVMSDDGKEILIPALKSVVLKVDVKNKYIKVRLPEGL
jgi:16S rRNA processing protein RimM